MMVEKKIKQCIKGFSLSEEICAQAHWSICEFFQEKLTCDILTNLISIPS